MKKYTQEEISESQGRQSRYQVMPLDEDGNPAKYYGIPGIVTGKQIGRAHV